jgi:hypothetical protein
LARSRKHPECPNPSDRSIAADLLLRHEPDKEQDEDEDDRKKEENDDDEDDGHSE